MTIIAKYVYLFYAYRALHLTKQQINYIALIAFVKIAP